VVLKRAREGYNPVKVEATIVKIWNKQYILDKGSKFGLVRGDTLQDSPGNSLKIVFTFQGIVFEDSILINKGKNDGVRKDFPVILADKILIGKVADVYDSFSRVALITNKDSAIDVEVQGLFALAKGQGNLKMILDLFPKDKELNEGALVCTSALGGIYPSGLVVGQVRNIKKLDNEAFIRADIEPAFNLSQLDRVFVIKTAKIIND